MPGAPIKLIDPNGDLQSQVYGLVDSGADFSTLPLEWAAQLGIDLDDCLEHQGETAGGLASRYLYEPGIRASFMGRKIHLAACFAPCAVVLLGREDFFQYFKVSFNQPAQTFHVEAVGDWTKADRAAGEAIQKYATNVRLYLEYLESQDGSGGNQALVTAGLGPT